MIYTVILLSLPLFSFEMTVSPWLWPMHAPPGTPCVPHHTDENSSLSTLLHGQANFSRPVAAWGDVPEDNPPLVAVSARAGDAIVFTEAITHGR